MSKKNTNTSSGKKKSKITFPKVMLVLAIVVVLGIVGYVIFDKINSSAVKDISIGGAYSELYVGNPEYDEVSYNVSVYPSNANQAFSVSSSNSSVAQVSITEEGKIKIKAVGEGSAKIVVKSKSKSSIQDSCDIVVKSIDVQNVTIYDFDNEVVDVNTNQVIEIQKDGLEHYIPFEISPLDGNMDKLQVTSFDKNAIQNVWIDAENRKIVVVPYTNIDNKIVTVYLGIYQNTTKGSVVSKNIPITISLVERKAYLKFEFAHESEGGGLSFSDNHKNIVYLDPTSASSIGDFYAKINIAYDEAFKNIGEFNASDFRVSVSDTNATSTDTELAHILFDYGSTSNSAEYKDASGKVVFTITKEDGSKYYRIVAGEGFVSDDATSYKFTFTHKYTGDKGEIEVKYFEQNLLSVNGSAIEDWKIKCNDDNSLDLDENSKTGAIRVVDASMNRYAVSKGYTILLRSNIDKGIEKGILGIYTVSTTDGSPCNLFTDEKGNSIKVYNEGKRIKLEVNSTMSNTYNNNYILVRFKFFATYWDSRYVSSYSSLIANQNSRDVRFTIDDLYETNGNEFKELINESSQSGVDFRNGVGDIANQKDAIRVVGAFSDNSNIAESLAKVANDNNTYYIFKLNGSYYKLNISSATDTSTDDKSQQVTCAVSYKKCDTTYETDGVTLKSLDLGDGVTISDVENILDITVEGSIKGKLQIKFGFFNLTKTIHFTIG